MGQRGVQVAIIGNPENRRVSMFQAALAGCGLGTAHVIPYLDLLQPGSESVASEPADTALRRRLRETVTALPRGTVLRIESPGENFAVARELLALGAGAPGAQLSALEAHALTYRRGLICAPTQQFAGYRALLEALDSALATRPDIRLMNAPRAVALLFDKERSRRLVAARGVRIPGGLAPISGYDELRRAMHEAGTDRAFIKLRHGSSASGVVAFRTGVEGDMAITSTVMRRRDRRIELFNSLALRRYQRRRDTVALIDNLARENVIGEVWIDKASMGDERCDLRILTIAGQTRHAVVRCSRSPLTNLHLGNRRATIRELVDALGEKPWREARALAEAAAACVPDALHVGMDVMIEARTGRPYLVEMNAFGDLLPGIEDGGEDTYSAEIRAILG